METRLLHPGVSTPDILTAYIAAIRTMRVLDPTGLLLETVTQPVHQYLRSREDTVRYVYLCLYGLCMKPSGTTIDQILNLWTYTFILLQ